MGYTLSVADDNNQINYFAATNSRGKEVPFGIRRKDRERHVYVIGKTGMGKSTLLENMAIQDIRNGEGIAFIDPHGQTADRILEYVPEHRIKDVLYFAPFDMEHPVAFNVMEDVGYDKRHLVVSGLLSAFRKIWVDAWSARMEYILSNTLLALLEYPGATLLDVNRMLVNKGFRKKVVENIKDPVVKSFWVEEFAVYTDRYTQEATPAIQNKVGQFTSNPLIRNIIGQPKSSFDIRQMMDEKKIIIINLSKGKVGEVNATLLGSMLVTKIYLAAMSRADVPTTTLATLPPFYFYVDEFQSFANQSFADILSEARKYKLNLIIAHQYIEQMEEEVRDAVFGNVGTTITFRVGPFDAEVLETIFSPQFMATDLVNLGFAQVYLTLMIDGVGSPPFSATTLPPFDPSPKKFVQEVLATSRTQFSKQRTEVEETIKKWNEADLPTSPEAPKVRKAPSTAPAHSATIAVPTPSVPRPTAHTTPATSTTQVAPATAASVTPPPSNVHKAPHMHAKVHPHSAQELGKEVQHQHAIAASRAGNDRPPAPHRTPERPPDGAKSLREALMQATGKQGGAGGNDKKVGHGTHAPDLKETLSSIAPKAQKQEVKQGNEHQKKQDPPGLPKEVLESMLAVDETEDTGASEQSHKRV